MTQQDVNAGHMAAMGLAPDVLGQPIPEKKRWRRPADTQVDLMCPACREDEHERCWQLRDDSNAGAVDAEDFIEPVTCGCFGLNRAEHLALLTDEEREYYQNYRPEEEDVSDPVNHPAHYGGRDDHYEAIKVIEAWDLDFCLGNTVKYIARAGKKNVDKTVEDLEKARWYLDRAIQQRQPSTGDTG